MVRATSSGITQIIDPRGRDTASLKEMESGALLGEAQLMDGLTPYARVGYLIPYVCGVVSIFLVVALLFRHGRRYQMQGRLINSATKCE